MGGINTAAPSSLEQLKALDSIPGLEDQLEEAHRLCSHRVRADMILKWLLEKLKKNPMARINTQTWETLASTLRLLSPERIGALLPSSTFFRTMQIALSGSSNIAGRLATLADLLTLLITTSNGPDGVPVKAILSLPAKNAAVFLGVWSRAIVNYYEDGVVKFSEWQRYIKLGFEIWALRKHSADENEAFADECLLPLTRLLSTASSDLKLFPDVSDVERLSRRKRRQGHDSGFDHPDIDLPQLHIARHVFIPARKAFIQMEAHGQSGELSRQKVPAQAPGPLLERMLGSMKVLVQSVRTDESSSLVDYFPSLLAIALRCISLETPKQLSDEKPWVFALWRVLYDILCSIPVEAAKESVSEMLSVIQRSPVSLSQTILGDVADRFGWLSDGRINYSIVEEIVAIDAAVFAVSHVAEPLFAAITAAVVHQNLHVTNINSAGPIPQGIWTEPIVIPIMQAFARSQNLPAFIQLWEQQLMEDNHEQQASVWTSLEASFAPLIEDTLADDQILQLFARQYKKFDIEEEEINLASQPKLNAAIVVLNALLQGIKREAILDQILPELQHLFMILPSTDDEAVSPFYEWKYWSLATQAFALWFPLWAAKQLDADTITACAHKALGSPAMTAASAAILPQCREQELEHRQAFMNGCAGTSYTREDACHPAHLITTVCYHLYNYPSLREACTSKLNELAWMMEVCDLSALLCYPPFVSILDSDILHRLLAKCIQEGKRSSQYLSALLALISSEISQGESHMIEPMLDALLPVFATTKPVDEQVSRNLVVMSLIEIQPKSFSRAQRERIIDALTAATWELRSPNAEIENQRRLALMISLMRTANPTCKLSTEPTVLRKVASQVMNVDNSEATVEVFQQRSATLVLLKELTRRVFSHLVATQDQERSRKVLLSISEQLVKDIGKPSKLHWSAEDSYLLSLSTVVLDELETGCRPALRDALAHRDSKFAKRFVKALLEKVNDLLAGLSNIEDRQAGADEEAFPPILDAFLDLPISYLDFIGLQRRDVVEPAASFLQSMLLPDNSVRLRIDSPEESSSLPLASIKKFSLVRSFYIVSKFASEDITTEMLGHAEGLLQLELEPSAQNQIRKAFEQGIGHTSQASQQALIHRLLAGQRDLTRAGLVLLPICLKQAEKEAVDGSSENDLGRTLHILLDNALRTSDIVIFTRAMQCIDAILKDKPFLANQHAIESILINIAKLARHDHNPATAYELAMRVFSTLFLSHRSRLQGRYHLVVRALQQLLSQLFTSTDFSSTPVSRRPSSKYALTRHHATAYARLLTLLCDPPQRQLSTTPDGLALIDAARREQAHAGQHVPVLLHQFCVQMLHGRLAEEGMREALNPGLWAVVEAMEMHEAHGVRVLSACMNENERAVLRGVYAEWRRFGKWRGG